MIMCMYKQKEIFHQSVSFHQIAVSNWELYSSEKMIKNSGLEDYAEFLAGLVRGEQRCLHGKARPDILIVREKQLSESKYVELFVRLWDKIKKSEQNKKRGAERQALLIPHTYLAASQQTNCGWLHLPLPVFREYKKTKLLLGLQTGTSIHSVEEAREAQEMGAAYVLAGHIFSTNCKRGVPPRGLEFLEQVCASVTIPVYAIGGIQEGNILQIQKMGASGVCRMSEYML